MQNCFFIKKPSAVTDTVWQPQLKTQFYFRAIKSPDYRTKPTTAARIIKPFIKKTSSNKNKIQKVFQHKTVRISRRTYTRTGPVVMAPRVRPALLSHYRITPFSVERAFIKRTYVIFQGCFWLEASHLWVTLSINEL